MKALYYCIGISLFLGLAACGQREAEQAQKTPAQEQEKEYRVHFTTGSVETKTAFGDAVDDGAGHVTYPAYWTANDRSVMISLNYEQAVTAGVNADRTDGAGHIIRASFDASFTGIEASNPYRFYLVSPASAFMWPSATRSGVSFFVPGTQKPTAASVDEAAQILVARSDAYTAIPEAVEVDFDHITAYGKLTLNNVNPGTGVSVESVTLWSENQPIAGSWYYKFSDGSIQEKEPSGSLVINTENINVAAGDPVWFACAPAGLGGKPLKIAVNLSNGKALVRTITLNPTVNFAAGKIIRFSVNMASATLVDRGVQGTNPETVFQKVTSSNNLGVGDEVIFVDSATNPAFAMTAAASGSGLGAVARDAASGFTLGDDGHIRLPQGSSVLQLSVASKSGSYYTFSAGANSYLQCSSSGSPRVLQLYSSSSFWTLSFSGGAASMYFSSSGQNYYLKYASGIFGVSTGNVPFGIYKKVTVQTPVAIGTGDDAVLAYLDYGAYFTDRNLVYNSTTDQLSREYGSSGTMTFAIVAPAEVQCLEFAGIPSNATLGDSFELHVTYISGYTTELEGYYSVAVVREDGPKLWLADAAGNGFIVKR
jgi:hypothetical protein